MIAAILYFLTAAACIFLASRYVLLISRRAALVLLLLPLCFTGRALLTGRVYAPIDLPYQSEPLASLRTEHGIEKMHNPLLSDVYSLNIPWKKVMRVAYSRGEWPLWNPYIFGGDILIAAAQPTPYEPFFLLSLLVPLANSLTFQATTTLFLAGLCMFLFIRDLPCREEAALIGAAGWMFGNFLVFWLPWVITPTVLWLPLVLLGVRLIIRRGGAGDVALLTFAFTMMLLSGHPESALHIVALGMAYSLYELAVIRPPALPGVIGKGMLAGVLALLITLVQVLPIVEALPQTMEHDYREAVYANQHRSRSLEQIVALLKMNAIPFIFGDPRWGIAQSAPINPTFDNAYAGSVLLGLALYGLFFSKSRIRWVMLAMGIFGLLAGTDSPPLANLMAKVPLFDIALNNRYIFATLFALSVLAAFGVEHFLTAESARPLARIFAALGVALFVVVATQWEAMLGWKLPENAIRDAAIILIGPLLVGAALLSTIKSRRNAFAMLLILLLAQRTAEMGSFQPTIASSAFYPPFPGLQVLRSGEGPQRIVGHRYTFVPNLPSMYGLEDVRGYQAMTFLRYTQTYALWSVHQPVWFNRVDDLSRPFLSFLNVRYALVGGDIQAPPGWRKVFRHDRYVILENDQVLPRAFVPRKIRINTAESQVINEMLKENDFGERAWISHPSGQQKASELINGPGTVTIEQTGLGRFKLDVRMANPGWLVVSEAHWKGWKAFSGNRRLPLRFANHAFIGMFLPAGEQTIDLVYLPRSFVVGGWVSGLTLLGVIVYALVRRRRNLVSAESPPPLTNMSSS